MATKECEQWIQQASSVWLTRVAVLLLGCWAHHMLLHCLREVMTQFSVGVLPLRRHESSLFTLEDSLQYGKKSCQTKSFNLAFHREGQGRGEPEGNTDI